MKQIARSTYILVVAPVTTPAVVREQRSYVYARTIGIRPTKPCRTCGRAFSFYPYKLSNHKYTYNYDLLSRCQWLLWRVRRSFRPRDSPPLRAGIAGHVPQSAAKLVFPRRIRTAFAGLCGTPFPTLSGTPPLPQVWLPDILEAGRPEPHAKSTTPWDKSSWPDGWASDASSPRPVPDSTAWPPPQSAPWPVWSASSIWAARTWSDSASTWKR